MKQLLLIPLTLSLTACLSSGGGDQAAAIAQSPETQPEPNPTPSNPNPAPDQPSFGLSYFSSKSLTSAYGSISLSNGFLTDAYCGTTYQVISQSESNGSVTIVVSGLGSIQSNGLYPNAISNRYRSGASYTYPNHNGCTIDVADVDWFYQENTSPARIYFALNSLDNRKVDMPWQIEYQMTESSGNVAVSRILKSFPYRRSTTANSNFEYIRMIDTETIQSMNYSLQ